ncbi:hypothetical protein [Ferruginivarius sediminum]|uniref:hypothetical protein n=1 Tax=Ferruginivarius sediminum TaxID=2661937 RepID=UPI0011C018AC|nr:hypothetical protein [Ferruginivarius sediminum]
MADNPEKTIKLNLNETPQHAEALGDMTVAWSLLEFRLLSLFQAVSGMNRDPARAIFYNLQSFRAKCDSIQAMARISLPSKTCEKIESFLKKVNKTAAKRNKYTHNPWATLDGEAGIWDLSHRASIPTLSAVKLKDLHQTTQQIYQWSDDMDTLVKTVSRQLRS